MWIPRETAAVWKAGRHSFGKCRPSSKTAHTRSVSCWSAASPHHDWTWSSPALNPAPFPTSPPPPPPPPIPALPFPLSSPSSSNVTFCHQLHSGRYLWKQSYGHAQNVTPPLSCPTHQPEREEQRRLTTPRIFRVASAEAFPQIEKRDELTTVVAHPDLGHRGVPECPPPPPPLQPLLNKVAGHVGGGGGTYPSELDSARCVVGNALSRSKILQKNHVISEPCCSATEWVPQEKNNLVVKISAVVRPACETLVVLRSHNLKGVFTKSFCFSAVPLGTAHGPLEWNKDITRSVWNVAITEFVTKLSIRCTRAASLPIDNIRAIFAFESHLSTSIPDIYFFQGKGWSRNWGEWGWRNLTVRILFSKLSVLGTRLVWRANAAAPPVRSSSPAWRSATALSRKAQPASPFCWCPVHNIMRH